MNKREVAEETSDSAFSKEDLLDSESFEGEMEERLKNEDSF